MGFSVDISIPVLTVFLQGIFSFFSPCVLPVVPLYIGYLSGGAGRQSKRKVMMHTVFFVIGISFAFFALGLGTTAIGRFFKGNQVLFARIGGIFVAAFGLYQLGVFGPSRLLSKEHRLPFSVNAAAMSPATAFLMGFTFSFAWTPCVGPALASVLLMAASAASRGRAFLLIGVYTAGFVLPFLAVGMFSTSLLNAVRKRERLVSCTVRAGAVLMILMGVMMFTGKMNSVTGYLSAVPETGVTAEDDMTDRREESEPAGTAAEPEEDGGKTPQTLPAVNFTLEDQYGNSHTFSDYKGKTVFLNFWATWCPPCRRELPDIQKLYMEYQESEDPEVIIMGIAAPGYGQEKSEEEICRFLEENGYTYPVVMDVTGEVFEAYGIYSYPTTIMVDRNGNVFGYATGQLSEEMMRSIIEQTVTGVRK